MKKIALLMVFMILVSFLIISGCAKKPKDLNICGDGICTLTEDCNTCPQDCACGAGEYCDSIGICRTEVCGDEVCSDTEKSSGTCCQDCGCVEYKVCNKVTGKCQEKIEVAEDVINTAVSGYLTEKGITGKIIKIIDTYYQEQTIKEVSIDCAEEGAKYPCGITLFINENGEIIKDIRTT